MRKGKIERKTSETQIEVELELDGSGISESATGIGFLDHMLDQLACHGGWNLRVLAKGDLGVDAHHTVEDCGICLGLALRDALGARQGIVRFGHGIVPMDESVAEVVVDLGGRAYFELEGEIPRTVLGQFDSELVEEFLRALAMNAKITLHVFVRKGSNVHHIIEAIFKALARAFAEAVHLSDETGKIPSTKGMIDL